MNQDDISTELQFDDFIDIKQAFKVDEDKEKKDDFANQVTIDPMKDLEKAISKSKQKNDLTSKKDEDEDQDDDVLEDNSETQDDNHDENEELTDEEKNLLQQVQDLKQIGALFLPDDYEVESIEKAIEDSQIYRNSIAVNTIFNTIPDVEIPGIGNAKDLFVYLYEHKGKSVEDFKSTFGVESFDASEFDLEKESDRRKVLDIYFTKKGFTEVKKNKLIDKIFDNVEDEQEAKDALEELDQISAKEKEEHLEKLKEQKLRAEEEAQQTYNYMLGILDKNNNVGGFPIGKNEKPKALNSLYRQVNVNGQVMTDFDYRLRNVVLQNPELTLALSAFLNTLSSDNTGKPFFDLSKIEKQEKTKIVSNLQKIAGRVQSGSKRLTSSADDSIDNKKGKFKWDSVVDFQDLD